MKEINHSINQFKVCEYGCYSKCTMNTLKELLREKTHSNVKICDVSFSSRQNMDRHIATVHEGKKLRLSLLKKSTINKHIESVHEEKKPLKCETC